MEDEGRFAKRPVLSLERNGRPSQPTEGQSSQERKPVRTERKIVHDRGQSVVPDNQRGLRLIKKSNSLEPPLLSVRPNSRRNDGTCPQHLSDHTADLSEVAIPLQNIAHPFPKSPLLDRILPRNNYTTLRVREHVVM